MGAVAAVDERVTRLEERLASLREDLQELRKFSTDNRQRIHSLESGVQAVKMLAETIQKMPDQMRGIAREAAQQTLAASTREHRTLTSLRAQVISVCVGVGGLALAVGTLVEKAVS